jgi:ribosomal protein S18 acetylase RimI-like enzyme
MIYSGETMMTTEIKLLQVSQIDEASAILANAFNDDPIFSYFISQSDRSRINILKTLWKIGLRDSLPYNHIYTTTRNIKGVAAWIPPGKSSLNILRWGTEVLTLVFQVGWRGVWRILSVITEFEKYHKRDMPQPHWYLSILGVAPATQGQGIGSLLLAPILQLADQQNLPCYVETSTEKAVRFYQKNGFEVLRTIELPKQNLQFWTMKREPLSIS